MALHLALDRLSFIGTLHGIDITPWNRSARLALALLTRLAETHAEAFG
jgi:hypothetical protein